jgi:hypothetical protein
MEFVPPDALAACAILVSVTLFAPILVLLTFSRYGESVNFALMLDAANGIDQFSLGR